MGDFGGSGLRFELELDFRLVLVIFCVGSWLELFVEVNGEGGYENEDNEKKKGKDFFHVFGFYKSTHITQALNSDASHHPTANENNTPKNHHSNCFHYINCSYSHICLNLVVHLFYFLLSLDFRNDLVK